MKECIICGKEFKSSNNRQKYCNDCRVKQKRKYNIEYNRELRNGKKSFGICDGISCNNIIEYKNNKYCNECIIDALTVGLFNLPNCKDKFKLIEKGFWVSIRKNVTRSDFDKEFLNTLNL